MRLNSEDICPSPSEPNKQRVAATEAAEKRPANSTTDEGIEKAIGLDTRPVEQRVALAKVVRMLLETDAKAAREFLERKGLEAGRTKRLLAQRLCEHAANGFISLLDLLALLNEAQAWNKQHLIVYPCPDDVLEACRSKARFMDRLDKSGLSGHLGRDFPVLIPKWAEIVSIKWTPERVRCVLACRREWWEKIKESERFEGEFKTSTSQLKVGRAVAWLEIDFHKKVCVLSIGQIRGRQGYELETQRLIAKLKPIINLSSVDPIRVTTSIKPLLQAGKVVRHEVGLQDKGGEEVWFRSRRRNQDFQGSTTLAVMSASAGNLAGKGGSFLVNADGTLGEIPFKVNLADQSIGFSKNHSEQEVRHVVELVLESCG